jgi:Uma2 family endonuclease
MRRSTLFTLSHPFTYADLERRRESSDERLELIEGELCVPPSPTPFHQFVSQRLYDLLKLTVVDPGHGLIGYAPFDVKLDEQNVVQPDLLVLLGERTQRIGETSVEGAPSLVIEITSPSTIKNGQEPKRDLYARFGVPEYWLVDPAEKCVTVYSNPSYGRYRSAQTSAEVAISVTIPGLSADLTALFAPVIRR